MRFQPFSHREQPLCTSCVDHEPPAHIPARGSLASSSQGQIPLPPAPGACMASFQLQTQHLPAVISRTASLSHSMSAFWHPGTRTVGGKKWSRVRGIFFRLTIQVLSRHAWLFLSLLFLYPYSCCLGDCCLQCLLLPSGEYKQLGKAQFDQVLTKSNVLDQALEDSNSSL